MCYCVLGPFSSLLQESFCALSLCSVAVLVNSSTVMLLCAITYLSDGIFNGQPRGHGATPCGQFTRKILTTTLFVSQPKVSSMGSSSHDSRLTNYIKQREVLGL